MKGPKRSWALSPLGNGMLLKALRQQSNIIGMVFNNYSVTSAQTKWRRQTRNKANTTIVQQILKGLKYGNENEEKGRNANNGMVRIQSGVGRMMKIPKHQTC